VSETEHTLAVYVDFENIALVSKQKNNFKFDINKVLERLVEKGKIVVKKAYADWSRYAEYKHQLHEAGLELIEIPKRQMTGKNSADIRLVVDALDMSWEKRHIDTFVIVSGDSDFSPLVSKLKENGKSVIGIGLQESSSNLLAENCDEFIYIEDIEAPSLGMPPAMADNIPKKRREVYQLLVDSIIALVRENKEILWSSMIKETMKRKRPTFSESAYGFRTFSELLDDAAANGLIRLRTNQKSGTYIVVGFGKEGSPRS
jgi:uncharacterized protein (TIGR00288 family)